MHATLFGNRVFADAIVVSYGIMEQVDPNPETGILIRERRE
jgi:hypothetical protein